jgi:hypothetical protein
MTGNPVALVFLEGNARVMAEVQRFRDDGSGLGTWIQGPILVRCPRCDRRAEGHLVDPDPVLRGLGVWRLTCVPCGLIVEPQDFGSDDRGNWGGLKLWLSAPFRGEVLWAYNASHLAFLRAYVSATQRERAPGHQTAGDRWETMTMVEKLPRWIKAADNRDPLLALIGKLERTL